MIICSVDCTKTLRLRIKDKHARVLSAMAREVNQVWNFCNETSRRAIRERHQWLSGYDLQNTISRNGVEYSHVLHKTVAGSPLIAKLQYARTDFYGDQLYSDFQHDISGSIGFKNLKPKAWIDEYRAGFTYTYADNNLKGFMVNAGYTF